MKEAQYILQSVTPRSLVVLDELCRHTTVEEGSAIAWSICEKLLLTTAFTFAATHFLHLTALRNMYHNVTTYVKILRKYIIRLAKGKNPFTLLLRFQSLLRNKNRGNGRIERATSNIHSQVEPRSRTYRSLWHFSSGSIFSTEMRYD